MPKPPSLTALQNSMARKRFHLSSAAAVLICALLSGPSFAQTEVSGSCTLTNHVYSCNGAVFQKALSNAKSIAIETHNVDGVARGQLEKLISGKLGKTIAPEGSPADLIFLMIPIDQGGTISRNPGDAQLGTLRIYSAAPTGARSQLLWAETYSGPPDLPWPVVVRRLTAQFQSHFHIK